MKTNSDYNIEDELIDNFKHIILNKFNHYCQVERLNANFFHLLDYLINHTIIKDKTVAKYMVMELYPESLFENKSKGDAISDISARTGISRRWVYNMVQHPERFGNTISKKSKKK